VIINPLNRVVELALDSIKAKSMILQLSLDVVEPLAMVAQLLTNHAEAIPNLVLEGLKSIRTIVAS
jgi:hypothetical protein